MHLTSSIYRHVFFCYLISDHSEIPFPSKEMMAMLIIYQTTLAILFSLIVAGLETLPPSPSNNNNFLEECTRNIAIKCRKEVFNSVFEFEAKVKKILITMLPSTFDIG